MQDFVHQQYLSTFKNGICTRYPNSTCNLSLSEYIKIFLCNIPPNQNSTQVRQCRFASLPQAPGTTTVQRTVPFFIEIDRQISYSQCDLWKLAHHSDGWNPKVMIPCTTSCKTVCWGNQKKRNEKKQRHRIFFSNAEFWTANCLGGQLWPLKAHDLKSCQGGCSGFHWLISTLQKTQNYPLID